MVYGFHVCYVTFMASLLSYVVYIVLLDSQRLDKLVAPLSTYAFALMWNTPHQRVIFLCYNFCYLLCLVPFTKRVNAECAEKRKSIQRITISMEPADKTQNYNLLQQATILFFLSVPVFQFVIAREQKFNVDATPSTGALGMLSNQTYPLFNGFQMAAEKWCTFILAVFFLWSSVHTVDQDSEDKQEQQVGNKEDQSVFIGDSSEETTPSPATEDLFYNANLVATMSLLPTLFCTTTLFLILCVMGAKNAFEECIMITVALSVISFAYCLVHLWSAHFHKIGNLFGNLYVRIKHKQQTKQNKYKSDVELDSVA
ncbi:hypothetical protein AKO1_008983, partial [Acrasis kona]